MDEERERLLKKIDELREKIEKSEPGPEIPQDIHSLIEMSDRIEECLNFWFY